MFLIFSAPQKRFMANGKSRLTVTALILSPKPASWSLNFLVCIWQTGVSSEGTTLMNVGLPFRSAGVTVSRAPLSKACSLNSGALLADADGVAGQGHGVAFERNGSGTGHGGFLSSDSSKK